MNEIDTLTQLKTGCSARVKEILTTSKMRRRLQDIGLIEGTNVQCLQKSPGGDPVAYLIRGGVIALRCEDSQHVIIEYSKY